MVRANRVVTTLTATQLERLAGPARDLQAQLAGSSLAWGLGVIALAVASFLIIVFLVVWTGVMGRSH